MPKYDVSIILNLHNEARYLKRTMLSLEEAVRYARQFDITFEIVVVLDNADKATTALAEAYDYSVFDAAQVIRVRNGSLGLSRNDGIQIAQGEYIATADADDLVSFNYFERLYRVISSSVNQTIVFPEYIVGFGKINYAWKVYGNQYVSNLLFFDQHPYLSRVIFSQKSFKNVGYFDNKKTSKFAYEDWHLNCEMIALGHSIEIAEGSVLFYRQRSGSLLQQAKQDPGKTIPASRFFSPEIYLKLCQNAIQNVNKPLGHSFVMTEFCESPGICDILAAANKIDPAISLGIVRHYPALSNLSSPSSGSILYYNLCEVISGDEFSDVVILPFLAQGGAEKYILSVLDAIHSIDSESSVLFICGQKYHGHAFLEDLPCRSLFVDLHSFGISGLDQDDIEFVTFRCIQNISGVKRVHFKYCEYASSLIEKYIEKISGIGLYYYYFSNQIEYIHGNVFTNGHNYNTVSECGHRFTAVISDNHNNLIDVKNIDPYMTPRSHVIYARCELGEIEPESRRRPRLRLLWASRLDPEKRPEMIVKIATVMEDMFPDVVIDVFGGSAYGGISPKMFSASKNIMYKGSFAKFSDIQRVGYDGFIYTTSYDGLPNVILEALSFGLPVISPNVGGIAEAVSEATGYLIENDTDDDALAKDYLDTRKNRVGGPGDAMMAG